MVFVESTDFTKHVKDLLTDEVYTEFQLHLVANPKAGEVIQGTGGLRKIRWSDRSGGKRGGVRVIYFHVTAKAQVRLLLIYKKGIKDDLTVDEKRVLRQLNENW